MNDGTNVRTNQRRSEKEQVGELKMPPALAQEVHGVLRAGSLAAKDLCPWGFGCFVRRPMPARGFYEGQTKHDKSTACELGNKRYEP